MKHSSLAVLGSPLLTKSTKYSILNHQDNLLFAPRRISPWASGGVIYFIKGENAR